MRTIQTISMNLFVRFRGSMTTFRRAEDGSMILLFLFFIMVIMAKY